MKPTIRTIVAASVFGVSVIPIVVTLMGAELTRGERSKAEATRTHRLNAVTKDRLANNCYQANSPIAKGQVFNPGEVPRSVCVTFDNSSYGFIHTLDGETRIVEVFPAAASNKAASQILNPKK